MLAAGEVIREMWPQLLLAALTVGTVATQGAILTPPYFNLAEGRRIYATATCGEGIQEPELYCKLVGANADRDVNINLIQGQVSSSVYCIKSNSCNDKTSERNIYYFFS